MDRIFERAGRWFETSTDYFRAHPQLIYLLLAAVFAVLLVGAILDKPWATAELYRYARQRFDPTAQWLGPKGFRIWLIVSFAIVVAGCLFLMAITSTHA